MGAIVEAAYGVRRVSTSAYSMPTLGGGMHNAIIQDLPKTKPREVNLSQLIMPGNLPFHPGFHSGGYSSIKLGGVTSGQEFFKQYMEVIKLDLENLGYRVTHHSHHPFGRIALSSTVPGDLTSATLSHALAVAGLTIQTESR